ncbi:hypothetical protein [Nocardia niwae]|uniref:hypothetical protein n=1 Tax=Nocardia niwae TaxID=626084 RepID=UPI0033EE3098
MSMLLSALVAVLLGLAPPAAQFKVAPGDVQTIPGVVSPHPDRDQDLDCAATGNLVCNPAPRVQAWGPR